MSEISINKKNSKKFAKRLQKTIKEKLNIEVTLTHSHELLAQTLGATNWHHLDQILVETPQSNYKKHILQIHETRYLIMDKEEMKKYSLLPTEFEENWCNFDFLGHWPRFPLIWHKEKKEALNFMKKIMQDIDEDNIPKTIEDFELLEVLVPIKLLNVYEKTYEFQQCLNKSNFFNPSWTPARDNNHYNQFPLKVLKKFYPQKYNDMKGIMKNGQEYPNLLEIHWRTYLVKKHNDYAVE